MTYTIVLLFDGLNHRITLLHAFKVTAVVAKRRKNKRSNQVVEVIGRSRLIETLLRARLEVARPERDCGIDLIAYVDRHKGPKSFIAYPLQLKAASYEQFSIEKKYARISRLILIYIWHVRDKERSDIYALTYRDALRIGRVVGWTKTKSWRVHGRYTTQRPSMKLKERLQGYKMTGVRWLRRKITGS
jgi:hypothetical protein